ALHVDDFGRADALEDVVAAIFFAFADNNIRRITAKRESAFFRTRRRGRTHKVNPQCFIGRIVFRWHGSCPETWMQVPAVRDYFIFWCDAAAQPELPRTQSSAYQNLWPTNRACRTTRV